MMGRKNFQREWFYSFSLEERVPPDHLLRSVLRVVDFSFVRGLVRDTYSHTGASSVDPAVVFKMALLGYLYGITSERRLAEEIRLNLAYMWFLGYDLDEKPPDHSILSKARRRYGPEACRGYKPQCTRAARCTITRPVDMGTRDWVDAHPGTARARRALRRRACSAATVFADLKGNHGLGRAALRGAAFEIQALLAAAAHNIKRLAQDRPTWRCR